MPLSFRLEKVLQFRRYTRQERQHALAAAAADENQLVQEQRTLEQQRHRQISELAQFAQADALNVEAAARRRYFIGRLDLDLLMLEQRLLAARRKVEACRIELVKADQDVQAIERLKEKQLFEQSYAESRRSEHELGEQWQAVNWTW